jgi:hypothetical protein
LRKGEELLFLSEWQVVNASQLKVVRNIELANGLLQPSVELIGSLIPRPVIVGIS